MSKPKITLKRTDHLKTEIQQHATDIFSMIDDEFEKVDFACKMISQFSKYENILIKKQNEITKFQKFIETEKKINSKNEDYIKFVEKVTDSYRKCFQFFGKREEGNYSINKVRSVVMENIVERILCKHYQSPHEYQTGCKIYINNEIVQCPSDNKYHCVPSTVDFVGLINNDNEVKLYGYESKTSDEAFIGSGDHIEFLIYLVETLERYENLYSEIHCVALSSSSEMFKSQMISAHKKHYKNITKLYFNTIEELYNERPNG